MSAIDDLVRQGLEAPLENATQVVYVSPLKALSNDIHKISRPRCAGIRQQLRPVRASSCRDPHLGRTGDTPSLSASGCAIAPRTF